MESLHRTTLSILTFKDDKTFFTNLASNKHAQSFILGIERVLKGATLDLLHNSRAVGAPSAGKFCIYITAPYAEIEASINPCTITQLS